MDVILLERVGKLGNLGDVVSVKDGYARNFLLPAGKAIRANKANKAKFEADRAVIEAANAEKVKAASTDSDKLNGASYILIRQAGESGQLFGSVSPRDIAEAASASGIAVNRNHVLLPEPIKTIGMYEIVIALHSETEATVMVNVARSQDEAEAQARGETVVEDDDGEYDALAAAEALLNAEEDDEAEAAEQEAADAAADAEEENK